jgi:hypothetical protein
MIVRATPNPHKTTFYTPRHFDLQFGKVVYHAGGKIRRHSHRPMRRVASSASEVLLVQKGRLLLELFGEDHRRICSREIKRGDVIILVSGGHGFKVIEKCVLNEIKLGPYFGAFEKRFF